MHFYSLGSGSSGNCYYLGDSSTGILIDAGIPAGSIRKLLKEINIPIDAIKGILVTHNHIDHIRGLKLFSGKNFIPVYTTPNVWNSIEARLKSSQGISVKKIEPEQSFLIDRFEINAFSVSHDAPETIGFRIVTGNQKLILATDLGYISDKNASYMKTANLLVIESNYDKEMLMGGNYPSFLKNRIASDQGHLDNQQMADFIAENCKNGLRQVCLAHLSKSNNTPEKALQTLQKTLAEKGIEKTHQPEVCVLKRFGLSERIRLL